VQSLDTDGARSISFGSLAFFRHGIAIGGRRLAPEFLKYCSAPTSLEDVRFHEH
jgi:hypothetical protein